MWKRYILLLCSLYALGASAQPIADGGARVTDIAVDKQVDRHSQREQRHQPYTYLLEMPGNGSVFFARKPPVEYQIAYRQRQQGQYEKKHYFRYIAGQIIVKFPADDICDISDYMHTDAE